MKLICAVLVFICVAVHGYQSEGFLRQQNFQDTTWDSKIAADLQKFQFIDAIKKFIDALIQNTLEAVSQITYYLGTLYTQIKFDIEKFVDQTITELLQFWERLEEDIIVGLQNGASDECIQKHRPDIREAINATEKDIKYCVQKGFLGIQLIQSGFEVHVLAIKENIHELGEVLKNCTQSFNPVTSFMCAFNKVEEIRTAIGNVLTNAKDAVVEIPAKLAQIAKSTQECVSKTVESGKVRLQEISELIKKCSQESGIKTTSTTPKTTTPDTTTTKTTTPDTTTPTLPTEEQF